MKLNNPNKLETFLEKLPKLSQFNAVIAGGFITSIVNDMVPDALQDIDIFCLSKNDFDEICLYLHYHHESDFINLVRTNYVMEYYIGNYKIQVIKKIYDIPEDVLRDFDLSCCQNAYDLKTGKFISICEQGKKYNINIPKISSLTSQRIAKYLQRGFEPVNLPDYIEFLVLNTRKMYEPTCYGSNGNSGQMLNDLFFELGRYDLYQYREQIRDIITSKLDLIDYESYRDNISRTYTDDNLLSHKYNARLNFEKQRSINRLDSKQYQLLLDNYPELLI